MEAPVIMDRSYHNSGASTITTSNQSRPLDTTFSSGRQPLSNYGYGNNQANTYTSTSSTSSFRQEGPSLRETTSFNRNSPLRDPYSSTTSSSTFVGGNTNANNNVYKSSSTITSQKNYSTNDGTKNVTYTFDLHQFTPEEIAIQVNDTTLKVIAVKQERDGHGSTHQEFRREIGLPEGADPKSLTNTLGPDGILTVDIPVRDCRPPSTPTYSSQQYNTPSNIHTNDSCSMSNQQLKLTFDLSGYKPEDVSVKVNDNVLRVYASHVDNTAGKQVNLQYERQYVLPDWVDVDRLRAKMSDDSTLTIEAPLPNDHIPAFNRHINVTHH